MTIYFLFLDRFLMKMEIGLDMAEDIMIGILRIILRVIKTALCFDFQVLKEIPAEIHDCRMKRIITEKRIIEIEEELS